MTYSEATTEFQTGTGDVASVDLTVGTNGGFKATAVGPNQMHNNPDINLFISAKDNFKILEY